MTRILEVNVRSVVYVTLLQRGFHCVGLVRSEGLLSFRFRPSCAALSVLSAF